LGFVNKKGNIFLLLYNLYNKMCDTAGAINGYYTPTDMKNATTYARMKILYERVLKYPNKIIWVDNNADGSSSYICPPNLTCKDGYVRIANETECSSLSNKSTEEENADNGYYLEWRSKNPSSGEGQCYRGNSKFRKSCELGNFANDETYPVKGLYYDTYSGRCFITPEYCSNIGEKGYIEPTDNIPDYIRQKNYGGSCELSGSQKFLDFIFGDTFAKGIIGGKCFK